MTGVVLHRRWLGIGLVVLIAAAAFWVTDQLLPHHGNPDPGGQIRHGLETAQVALPADAKVRASQIGSPSWDSCDGQAGTFGWDDLTAYYRFTSLVLPATLLEGADARMRAAGWTSGSGSSWTRTLPGGTAWVTLQQVGGPSSNQWQLDADAPPVGTRVSGC